MTESAPNNTKVTIHTLKYITSNRMTKILREQHTALRSKVTYCLTNSSVRARAREPSAEEEVILHGLDSLVTSNKAA